MNSIGINEGLSWSTAYGDLLNLLQTVASSESDEQQQQQQGITKYPNVNLHLLDSVLKMVSKFGGNCKCSDGELRTSDDSRAGKSLCKLKQPSAGESVNDDKCETTICKKRKTKYHIFQRTSTDIHSEPKCKRRRFCKLESNKSNRQSSQSEKRNLRTTNEMKIVLVRKMIEVLQNPPSSHHQQSVLAILKADPSIRSLFLKERSKLGVKKIPVFKPVSKQTKQSCRENLYHTEPSSAICGKSKTANTAYQEQGSSEQLLEDFPSHGNVPQSPLFVDAMGFGTPATDVFENPGSELSGYQPNYERVVTSDFECSPPFSTWTNPHDSTNTQWECFSSDNSSEISIATENNAAILDVTLQDRNKPRAYGIHVPYNAGTGIPPSTEERQFSTCEGFFYGMIGKLSPTWEKLDCMTETHHVNDSDSFFRSLEHGIAV